MFRVWCEFFSGLGHPNFQMGYRTSEGSLDWGWSCWDRAGGMMVCSINEFLVGKGSKCKFRPGGTLWHLRLSPFCMDFGQVFVFVVVCALITRHRGRHKWAFRLKLSVESERFNRLRSLVRSHAHFTRPTPPTHSYGMLPPSTVH